MTTSEVSLFSVLYSVFIGDPSCEQLSRYKLKALLPLALPEQFRGDNCTEREWPVEASLDLPSDEEPGAGACTQLLEKVLVVGKGSLFNALLSSTMLINVALYINDVSSKRKQI